MSYSQINDFFYMTFLRIQKISDGRQIRQCQGLEMGAGWDYTEAAQGDFWGDRTVLYLGYDDNYINLSIHVLKFTEPYIQNHFTVW